MDWLCAQEAFTDIIWNIEGWSLERDLQDLNKTTINTTNYNTINSIGRNNWLCQGIFPYN